MTGFRGNSGVAGRSRMSIRLLAAAMLLLFAGPALAANCSDAPYFGVIDGDVVDAPDQIQIDQNCTIRNFPASNPLITNFSFLTQPGQTENRWLVVFDNVFHVGNMSCNSVLQHKIWFTNGSSSKIKENCQNLLIPVEKIDKQNPPGQDTAVIGLPFTYRLTIPVLFDPATDTVINSSGSPNDVHGIVIQDDLNATGANLSYVSHTAYWLDTGAAVPHSFSDVGGLLTFQVQPIIPAGEQIVIELTVVLDNTPANAPGTQFINTAKWEFGRLIEGVFYEPLPGEWGVTEPMTVAAPDLTLTKSGPATLNLGEAGDFTLDIQNVGNIEAWDPVILDQLPNGPAGGTCETVPIITGAQVFAADGVTPVPGKGPLQQGSDFLFSYTAAPACELTLTMLSAAAAIGPGERLVVNYEAKLDTDTQDGLTLTNVAAATEWFDGDAGAVFRNNFSRTLTDGTVGVLDHEDAHTINVAQTGYFFEKSVANLSSGAGPAETAAPGDTLRYSLRLRTTDQALDDFSFFDDLGALNAGAAFVPGTLALVPGTLPPGADAGNTDPGGGTNGAGLIDIRGLSLPAGGELLVQFDIVLAPDLLDGTVVLNQAGLLSGGSRIADSDDPNINGLADPLVPGDEDPTRVLIETEPPPPLQKENTRDSAAIGEVFSYRLTVPSVPHTAPLYDVRILDDLAASTADLEFVGVTRISGSGTWTPVNTGVATQLVIEDPVNGIDIPAGEQAVVEISVRLRDTSTNVADLQFTNSADFTYNLLDDNDASVRPGGPGTTAPMTIVEPALTLQKRGPPRLLRSGPPGTFTLEVHNTGAAAAFGLTITDLLPKTEAGGMCAAAPTEVSAQLFEADGVTPAAPPLVAGTDFSIAFDGAPACVFSLQMLTAAAAIGPDQRLLVSYQAGLDEGTDADISLSNIAGATRWSSAELSTPADEAREYVRALSDGTVGVLDHEDAHTLVVDAPVLRFEKTVANISRGDDPGTLATPGETLRYRLRVENLSDGAVNDFSLRDELDRLNALPVFEAGTLNLVTVPPGADVAGTSATGGASGTGVLDVRNLSLANPGDSLLVEFDIRLAPVIANGTGVLNQAEVLADGVRIALSDDPNINGPSDPFAPGNEDPTRILVESAPLFRIEKSTSYPDGDPAVLLPGERLRYTITVKNIGTDNAVDASLRDEVPANTTYVPGSTTLNGAPVPDGPGDALPLSDGLLINAPEDPTPGAMRADASETTDNVATIAFDVLVNDDVVDGAVISNQVLVSAPGGGVVDQPSDDPETPIDDDPTVDVVGNAPLLVAEKRAALLVDEGTPGVVDPGDVLRYSITLYNFGNVAATGVLLSDPVPPDTTYLANSMFLNELPAGQPDGGISPLIAGLDVSSEELTPPLPAPGDGTLSPGGTALVRFDVRVNDAVLSGTIIRNQALVATVELPNQLTDADGNRTNGLQPTEVVVGDSQQLSITKQVAVVGGGAAVAGAVLEYEVRVVNIGAVPAFGVVLSDDLEASAPGQLSYVPDSATLNGSAAGVSVLGAVISADYSALNGPLAPADTVVLRFRATLDGELATGTTVTNTAEVRWNTPEQAASASVSLDIGGAPGVGALNGTAWHDADFDNAQGGTERPLADWTVELYRNDRLVHSTRTDTDGAYRIGGLGPNDLTGDTYALQFSAPGAGPATAALGQADSDFSNGLQQISDILVASGGNLQGLNLPIDPNGVVYDSVGRTPVSGATLSLLQPGSGVPLPAACFDDARQQGQVTPAGGYYKFDLNFSDPACPSGGSYLIGVSAPATGYVAGDSQIIPPQSDASTAPFSIPACPGSADDAVPATSEHCELQSSEFAPPPSVRARTAGTSYHLQLALDDSRKPGSSQAFNNHIPLDPVLDGALAITKTTPQVNVSRGQLVPYVITINNVLGADLQDVRIVDRFPAGFSYVEGSARLDEVPFEPVIAGRELSWDDLGISDDQSRRLVLLLAVGAGVTEGEFVNRAQALHSLLGEAISGEATATVRVVPDPTFDCTDVIGKVFDDVNRNGAQDPGEGGLAGVRLVTARGLAATTDAHGRFHITCAVVPRETRGSNFVLKLDDRSLPSGYRMSTEPVLVKRATRGKALQFNFGASIHRVVSLDLADPVFQPGSVEMRRQWESRIPLLLEELRKGPAVLRLSYLADIEDRGLVERRLETIKAEISDAWTALGCCYELSVESQIFWRRGEPR